MIRRRALPYYISRSVYCSLYYNRDRNSSTVTGGATCNKHGEETAAVRLTRVWGSAAVRQGYTGNIAPRYRGYTGGIELVIVLSAKLTPLLLAPHSGSCFRLNGLAAKHTDLLWWFLRQVRGLMYYLVYGHGLEI